MSLVHSVNRLPRWTPARKLDLLMAIEGGRISAEEAQTLHGLSAEELESWRRAFERGGQGFKVTDQGQRNRDRAARFQTQFA